MDGNGDKGGSSGSSHQKPLKRVLAQLFLFVFVDILGFSIVLPLLPYYAEEFGANAVQIGLLYSSNAIAQLISAPIIGRLSDHYGRRPLLLWCVFSTFVSFVMLAKAKTISALFLSRVLDGLFGGNISLAQAYITDKTSEQERAKGMGIIGAAFGIGFVVGPAVGGILCMFGHELPSWVAAALSLINFVGIYFFLPESNPDVGVKSPKARRALSIYDFLPFMAVFNSQKFNQYKHTLVPLMVMRFGYGLCFTLFETSFGMFNKNRLALDPRSSNFYLAYVGVVFSAVQGGGLSFVLRKFFGGSEHKALKWSFGIMALSLILWGTITYTTTILLILLTPLSLASGVLHTIINSSISKTVQHCEIGETMGVSASIGSLTRVVAPAIGGFVFQNFGDSAPGVCGGLVMGLVTYFTAKTLLVKQD